MLKKITQFLNKDIWRMRIKNYSGPKSFGIKNLRIIILSFKGFVEDQCKYKASALTLFTLLSLVPVIALMFAIAKGFGLQKRVEEFIRTKFYVQDGEAQVQIAEKIIEFSNSMLETVNSGFIAGVGVLFLLWAVIKLMNYIEESLNNIWGVKQGRSIPRKFSDYLAVVLLAPIILVIASSATVAFTTQVQTFFENRTFFFLGPVVIWMLNFLPYVLVWLLFTFVYIFMPGTRVRFKSALIAGIVAGTLFQIAQTLFLMFMIGSAKYNAIYGGFAAVPVFLIWLQVSWLILLFGAELSFAHQNVDTYEFEADSENASNAFKKRMILLVMHSYIKDFISSKPAKTAEEISKKYEIPIRLTHNIIDSLNAAGLITKVSRENDVTAYQPASDPDIYTIQYIFDQVEHIGVDKIPVYKSRDLERIDEKLNRISEDLKASPANIKLKEI